MEYPIRHVSLEGVLFASVVGGVRMVSNLQEQVEDYTVGSDIKDYWVNKLQIYHEDLDHVKWVALRNARQGFPPSKARWVTKFLSENCPTGTNMKKCFFWDEDKCPRGGETAEHVLRCCHPEVQQH